MVVELLCYAGMMLAQIGTAGRSKVYFRLSYASVCHDTSEILVSNVVSLSLLVKCENIPSEMDFRLAIILDMLNCRFTEE